MATTMNAMQKGKFPNCLERNLMEDFKAITLWSGKNVVRPVVGDGDEHVEGNPARFEKEKESEVERHVGEKAKNVPAPSVLWNALEQMSNYAKFIKDMLSKKKFEKYETMSLTEECSHSTEKAALKVEEPKELHHPLHHRQHDGKMRKLDIGEVQPTSISLQLVDCSFTYPWGIVEDVLVKVDKFIFPLDFVVLDMEEDLEVPIILGRPVFVTVRALITIQQGKLTLHVNEKEVIFNIYHPMKYLDEVNTCHRIDILDETVVELQELVLSKDYLEQSLQYVNLDSIDTLSCDVADYAKMLDCLHVCYVDHNNPSLMPVKEIKEIKPPVLELKQLHVHLSYAFLGESSTYPVIIIVDLTELEREKLLRVLRMHKSVIGWSIDDLKGISPSIVMHRILMEESYSPFVLRQMRLNLVMKEVVKAEVLKLLDA